MILRAYWSMTISTQRLQGNRFASKEVEAPQAVFHMTNEREPRRATFGRHEPVMQSQNAADDILILRNCFLRVLNLGCGNKLESKVFGFACQGSQRPLFKLLLVLLLTDVGIVTTRLQHAIDQARQFMGGGYEAFRFSKPGTDTAAKRAKRAATPEQTLRAEAKNVSSTIGRFSCPTIQHTTSTDSVIGAQRQP